MANLKIIFASLVVVLTLQNAISERIDENIKEDEDFDEVSADLHDPSRRLTCRPTSASSSISCKTKKHLRICTTCKTTVSICSRKSGKRDELIADQDESDADDGKSDSEIEDAISRKQRCRHLGCRTTRRITLRNYRKTEYTCRRCYQLCRRY